MEDDLHQGDIDVSWIKISSELKKSLDRDTFQNWIKPIHFENQSGTQLNLSVPTRFLRDWIIKNYASVIKRAYQDNGITIEKLSILVKENNNRIIPGTEVVYQDKEEEDDGLATAKLVTQIISASVLLIIVGVGVFAIIKTRSVKENGQ